MDQRSKIQKEADLYKDLSEKELGRVVRKYKCLSRSNSDIVNFIFTIICFGVPYFIIFDFSEESFIIFLLVHFLFFWEFIHKYHKFKLVSDEDKTEIDQVISILEDRLEEIKNKKPLE
jgi:hypothetical protein